MIKKTDSKTFHFNGLEIALQAKVYDPADDSFLVIDTVQVDSSKTVLEIGTGCGLIALEAARQGAQVVCTDINPHAVQLTKDNIEQNKQLLQGTIEVREGDLFSVIQPDECFDIIIFNPPYLPTSENDKVDHWFDKATDGGPDGLKVTKRFIEQVKKYLTSKGYVYFVFSSLSDRSKLEEYLKKEMLRYKVVLSRRFNDESLDIYCVYP